MSLRPKRGIAKLKKCYHGGINYAELKALGLKSDQVLDFSVCTNPFMPPPGIKETLKTIAIEQYPDSEATEFRKELSVRLGLPPENILAGSGTTELTGLIALAYFRKGDQFLILEPTYGEYEVAGRIAGARPVRYRAKEEDNFVPKIEDIADLIRKHHPRGVFICNPNNPTGKHLSRREIETNSANMHLIPSNPAIEDAIDGIRQGELIRLSGQLVRVDAEDGWHWVSSLSRDDTGNGACELIWVENLELL